MSLPPPSAVVMSSVSDRICCSSTLRWFRIRVLLGESYQEAPGHLLVVLSEATQVVNLVDYKGFLDLPSRCSAEDVSESPGTLWFLELHMVELSGVQQASRQADGWRA